LKKIVAKAGDKNVVSSRIYGSAVAYHHGEQSLDQVLLFVRCVAGRISHADSKGFLAAQARHPAEDVTEAGTTDAVKILRFPVWKA